MKSGVFWIAVLLFLASAFGAYDFTQHHNAHELKETLFNERSTVFVIYFYKEFPEDAEKQKTMDEAKAAVKSAVEGKDVVQIDVDMTEEDSATLYNPVLELLSIPTTLVDETPVVAVVYNGGGYWIHGKRVPDETVETVDTFIQLKKADHPTSSGRTGRY